MSSDHKSVKSPYHNFDINLLDCEFLGRGNNGIVYLLPDGNVIKICFEHKSFEREYAILEAVNGNKYFPRLYEVGGNYMIRECVPGESLSHYIAKNGLDEELSLKIIELLKEFISLNFTKIDIRCKDIFVQPNGILKVIDPKKFYTKERSFPRHLSKGLYKLGVLDTFLQALKDNEPKFYKSWYPEIDKYIKETYES
ncbi:protein kinase [Clostridium amazonitimonense]|uniref:protein kinase n=1 Tax=Clostridium amazonitimonense TaxID=1499689 RepID=UPI000509808F|nr:protein kinase [Clostridium amazonitimonense]